VGRTCIFCQSDGPMSKEHTFPAWLQAVFPASEFGPPRARFFQGDLEGPPYADFPISGVATQSYRAVCVGCNTGWMAGLEGRCRPQVTEMATGHPGRLEMPDQIQLATWAVKTAMVCEMTLADPRPLFDQTDRDLVRTEVRPPASVLVRVAAYEGRDGPLAYFKVVATVQRGAAHVGDLVFHTLKIGCLVLQVAAGPPRDDWSTHALGVPGNVQFPIFLPLRDRDWPPDAVLNDDTFALFRVPPSS
jgi:hypothetical protein